MSLPLGALDSNVWRLGSMPRRLVSKLIPRMRTKLALCRRGAVMLPRDCRKTSVREVESGTNFTYPALGVTARTRNSASCSSLTSFQGP